MNISQLLHLAMSVVADWRVIVTAVLTVFVISIANYVIRYKKRPPSLKKLKAKLKEQQASAKPKKKEAEQGDEAENEDEQGNQGSSSAKKK